jgi:hypothetical protein
MRDERMTLDDLALAATGAQLAIAWWKKADGSRTKYAKDEVAKYERLIAKLDAALTPADGGASTYNGKTLAELKALYKLPLSFNDATTLLNALPDLFAALNSQATQKGDGAEVERIAEALWQRFHVRELDAPTNATWAEASAYPHLAKAYRAAAMAILTPPSLDGEGKTK